MKTSQGIQLTRPAVINWLRGFNKRATNRLTMRFAGRRVYAVIHHRGRKSGAPYQTPVVAMPDGDGFIFPLPYGERVDWCRNLLAAGECRMEWRGRMYRLASPRFLAPAEALHAFPGWLKPLLRRTEIYLRMDRASAPELPADRTLRRVLVVGAGVLGSLFAARLHQAGYDVTLLARGRRLAELRERGVVLQEFESGRQECVAVPLTEHLAPEDAYDLVMVLVRKNQLESVLPALVENQSTPNVLFLMNNVEGPGHLVEALGRGRVLLGFPAAGGKRENGVVYYRVVPGKAMPTTLGEPDGSRSERLSRVAQVLEDAGLPVTTSANMDAWLKTHAAVVSPIANALYLAGGSAYRLARTRDGLVLMVRAIQDALRALQALHIPITPPWISALLWAPEPVLIPLLEKRLGSPLAELVLASHANAARDEMRQLDVELHALVRRSGRDTAFLDILSSYLDPETPSIPEGQAALQLDWRPVLAAGMALVSAGLLAAWLAERRGDTIFRKVKNEQD